jgi:hypothetical protein
MKKLTNLILESRVTDEYIEDCLIHLEDMGFKIESFDNVYYRDRRSMIFTNGEISSSGMSEMWGYDPTGGRLYRCHYLILSKKIRKYSDCEIWEKAVLELISFKRKLTRCDVYYTLDGTGREGIHTNAETDLKIYIFVVDKSEKIDQSSVERRQQMWRDIYQFMESDPGTRRIKDIISFSWTEESLVLSVSLGKKQKGSKNQFRQNKSIDALINFIDGESDKRKFQFRTDVVSSENDESNENLNITMDF